MSRPDDAWSMPWTSNKAEAKKMLRLWSRVSMLGVFVLGGACIAAAAPARMPMPGSLNSVQGHVSFGGQEAPEWPRGSERLRPGEAIKTAHGKAELLLTPGTFLRIGNFSEAEMLSRSLENTRVKMMKGSALVEAEADYKNDLTIAMDGARTRIEKKGFYGFDAGTETIGVLNGKAEVYVGDSRFKLTRNHQIRVGGPGRPRVRKLDKREFKSTALYRWNRLRDRYEARARRSVRQSIANSGHWYGPGWYWSGFWGFYTYLPSRGWFAGPYYGPYAGPYYAPYYGGWGGWGWWGDGDGD